MGISVNSLEGMTSHRKMRWGDCSESKQPGGSMLKSDISFRRDYADFQGKRDGGWAEKAAKGQTSDTVKAPGESPWEHVASHR